MPPKRTHLYDVKDSKDIKFGYTKGEHAPHILDNSDNSNVIDFYNVENKERNINLDQGDIYRNYGDIRNANNFRKLAEQSHIDYENRNDLDPTYIAFLEDVRSYVTAYGRAAQQKALKKAQNSYKKCHSQLPLEAQKLFEKKYNTYMNIVPSGYLIVPENKKHQKGQKITEPSNTFTGFFGAWTKSDDPLFSHIPSPNDIKQGIGVEDCYMLSALARIAASHPEEIMNAMRDNGDGTVTVKFYNPYKKDPVTNQKAEEFVTINKTVNKAFGSGSIYSSSSLWVQLYEKAYVKFLNEIASKDCPEKDRDKMKNGYYAINRGHTGLFMRAFSPTDDYALNLYYGFGSGNTLVEDYYDINAKGEFLKPRDNGYYPSDVELYKFFKKHTSPQKKDLEVVTVGLASTNKNRKQFALDHGIRAGHAYTVLGTFEKVVNGKTKLFVTVRDPYATFQSKYDENGMMVDDSSKVKGTLYGGIDTMGTFNLEISDFQKVFNTFSGVKESSYQELNNQFETIKNSNKIMSDDELAGSLKEVENLELLKPLEESDQPEAENVPVNEAENKPEVAENGMKEKSPLDDFEIMDESEFDMPEKSQVNEFEIPDGFGYDGIESYNEALYNNLTQPGGIDKLKRIIHDITQDVDSYDQFFMAYKNTPNFVKMRNALYAMNDTLKLIADSEQLSQLDYKRIAGQMTELGRHAKVYEESKTQSIKNEALKSKKLPSERASHRLMAAHVLSELSEGKAVDERLFSSPKAIKQRHNTIAKEIAGFLKTVKNDKNERINSDVEADLVGKLKDLLQEDPSIRNTVNNIINPQTQMQNPGNRHPEKSGANSIEQQSQRQSLKNEMPEKNDMKNKNIVNEEPDNSIDLKNANSTSFQIGGR